MGCFSTFLRFSNIRPKSNRIEDIKETHIPNPLYSPFNNKNVPWKFTWEEIERISLHFSNVLGHGGFSTVYLARCPDSTLAALKIINSNQSQRLNQLFNQELQILLQLGHHDNIVNLLGYCNEQLDESGGALVFECVPNGTLHEKLHHQHQQQKPLSWKSRMNIAFQLGEAIDYLHCNCSLQIVHGDIKSSNILLDDQLNCKLCDFGSAKMGFSSTIPVQSSKNYQLMGSPGYLDPHYLRTGIASKKNDVYSFGVVMLELITGMEAFCSENQQLLATIAKPMLTDTNIVGEMMDPKMEDYNLEEARVMTCIAAQCLREQPSLRPSMADILQTMKANIH